MPTKDEINRFSMAIETLAATKKTSFMEAVLLHCETVGLEVELSAKLISPILKKKIEQEARNLNYLPRTHIDKLPIQQD